MTISTEAIQLALADRYRIERKLGAGGMATVYLAEDLKHDRKVAVKVLRPELAAVLGAERFVQEIKTTAALQHPHILPLFDSGKTEGRTDGQTDSFLYYVMPYIEGETLRDKLDRETQLGIDEAVKIATEVADALDYAHRHGVIHRDIKPENILLHDGRPMVADFGIALAVSAAAGGRMTETGLSLGTPHYMSPEQATADKDITARSDIYSLGSVLYEMLAGEPPHLGNSAQQIIMKIVTDQARPVSELRKSVPTNVAAAVAKSLEKLPADRFSTAADFVRALTDEHFSTAAADSVPAGTAARRRMVSPVVTAGAGAALALLAAWGWLRALNRESQPPNWNLIAFPDDLEPMYGSPSMAFSPDGNVLVFRDESPDGMLWVKRRDALDPQPLNGTEGALAPVFSPDGEWIAFAADNRVKKVRYTGGTPIIIADSMATDGYGGIAWLDDGSLVYTPPSLTTLERVSANGGSISVALADTTLIGGGIGHPMALPGSRGVLFQYCTSGCVTTAIHVVDLRSGQRKLLLPNAVSARYLPNGQLLYFRPDGVGLMAPFDLARLEITGDPVQVLEEVAVQTLSGFAPFALSPAGRLIFIRNRGAINEILVLQASRRGDLTPVGSSLSGEFNDLALAPDGDRLALSVGRGGASNIWLTRVSGGPLTRLTFGGRERRASWSPDGQWVGYIQDTSEDHSAVFARRSDGSGSDTLLAMIDDQVQEVTWSPDGQWLVLRTDNTARGAGDLFGVPLDGGEPIRLVDSPFTELHPAISPDGKWLAYTSNESGIYEVYFKPLAQPDAGRRQISSGGGSQPVWARSGRELFYLDGSWNLMAVPLVDGEVLNVGSPYRLFNARNLAYDAFHQIYQTLPGDSAFLFLGTRQAAELGGDLEIVWLDDWRRVFEERLEQ